MLGLLGVSLFILRTNASLNVPDLDVKKLAGRWYLLGTAFGAGWIENPTWTEMVSKHLVMPAANGDLQVDSLLMTTNGPQTVVCTWMSHLLKRTKTPGIFSFRSLDEQTFIEVSFMDVKYGEYFITHRKMTMNENVTFSIRLFTRKPEVSLKVKNKLNQVALKQNPTPVKIIFLPYQGQCNW
ncbi:lipocalin-like [Clarias gariepinus]